MEISRHDAILKYIVEEYVKTAQPVGSNTLLQKYNLPYSSATIRNVMADLEAKGLIEKTHTSSGRVPSTKGYTYYAEHIQKHVDSETLDDKFKKEFQLVLSKKSQSVEDVLSKSCQILSEVTSMAAVVLGPDADNEHLMFINSTLLPDKTKISVYLMTDKGYTDSKTFIVHSNVEAASISKCIEIINNRLTGSPISEINSRINAMRPILSETIGQSSEVVIDALAEAFLNFAKQRMRAYGSEKLIELPEYESDTKKLQSIIDLLNNPTKIAELVEDGDDSEYTLSISEDDSNVAIFSKDCKIPNIDAKLAIVGPQRMDYKKIITMLQYMVKKIDEYFERSAELNTEGDLNETKKKGKKDGRK